jgi:secreted trypsin-like serine protease
MFITGGRLIDGIPASEGQFPWQVAIKTTSATFHYMCGGAIINEEWILTSGSVRLRVKTSLKTAPKASVKMFPAGS